MGCHKFFFAFTERVSERYPSLFPESNEESDAAPDLSSESNFNKKWNGYSSIAALSGNDVTKFDLITELPMHQCLTYLVYLQDMAFVQDEKNRKQLAGLKK